MEKKEEESEDSSQDKIRLTFEDIQDEVEDAKQGIRPGYLPSKYRRIKRIATRLSRQEKKRMKAASNKCGVTTSTYMRDSILIRIGIDPEFNAIRKENKEEQIQILPWIKDVMRVYRSAKGRDLVLK